MLWSSHPRKPYCDAAGPQVEGTKRHQDRRCSLLVWLGPSVRRGPVPTATKKVRFVFTRRYLFLKILSRCDNLMIEEYLFRVPEKLKTKSKPAYLLAASPVLVFLYRPKARRSHIWCQKRKTPEDHAGLFFRFHFRPWFLSSFHQVLGEMILDIPISSAKNSSKKSKTTKPPKSMQAHFSVFIFSSLVLIFISSGTR